MKKSFLTLTAAALLLCSCGGTPAASETSNPSATSSSAKATGWTAEEETAIRDCLNGILVPSFGIFDYSFSIGVDGRSFSAAGYIYLGNGTNFAKTVKDQGWTVSGFSEAYVDATYSFDDYSYNCLSVNFPKRDGGSLGLTPILIYAEYRPSFASWPEEDIDAYAKYTGLEAEDFPPLEGAEAYVHYIIELPTKFFTYVECHGESMDTSAKRQYEASLYEKGYSYNSEQKAYDNGVLYITTFLTEGCIVLGACFH